VPLEFLPSESLWVLLLTVLVGWFVEEFQGLCCGIDIASNELLTSMPACHPLTSTSAAQVVYDHLIRDIPVKAFRHNCHTVTVMNTMVALMAASSLHVT
ncbi:hypothetical protein BVRB_027420, partial [Beta vulgaris subsp. vulgaris]